MNREDMNLAITDIETSGLDERKHEILDIGCIIVNKDTLVTVSTFYMKVKPVHIETASETALMINGYNEEEWENAYDLKTAISEYCSFAKDCIFTAWNPTFDWAFLNKAMRDCEVEHSFDYHKLDIWTLAWNKLKSKSRYNSNAVCEALGIPVERVPHKGINGAMTELMILSKLQDRY